MIFLINPFFLIASFLLLAGITVCLIYFIADDKFKSVLTFSIVSVLSISFTSYTIAFLQIYPNLLDTTAYLVNLVENGWTKYLLLTLFLFFMWLGAYITVPKSKGLIQPLSFLFTLCILLFVLTNLIVLRVS